MINRRELEGLIETGIVELRHAEAKLLQDYQSLSDADEHARRAFRSSFVNFKRQARLVESLLSALQPVTSAFAPLAA
jgi:hypothetical protein